MLSGHGEPLREPRARQCVGPQDTAPNHLHPLLRQPRSGHPIKISDDVFHVTFHNLSSHLTHSRLLSDIVPFFSEHSHEIGRW